MDLKKLVLCACFSQLAACSAAHLGQQESRYYSNYALAVCLGSAFDDESVKSDFNKAANGYMERGNMPIEAFEELRLVVDAWLAKDYPSKHGGQVNSAKCIDFYNSDELGELFKKYNPCLSKEGWLSEQDFSKSCT